MDLINGINSSSYSSYNRRIFPDRLISFLSKTEVNFTYSRDPVSFMANLTQHTYNVLTWNAHRGQ